MVSSEGLPSKVRRDGIANSRFDELLDFKIIGNILSVCEYDSKNFLARVGLYDKRDGREIHEEVTSNVSMSYAMQFYGGSRL